MGDLPRIEMILSEIILTMRKREADARNKRKQETLLLAVRAIALDNWLREVYLHFVAHLPAMASTGFCFHDREYSKSGVYKP